MTTYIHHNSSQLTGLSVNSFPFHLTRVSPDRFLGLPRGCCTAVEHLEGKIILTHRLLSPRDFSPAYRTYCKDADGGGVSCSLEGTSHSVIFLTRLNSRDSVAHALPQRLKIIVDISREIYSINCNIVCPTKAYVKQHNLVCSLPDKNISLLCSPHHFRVDYGCRPAHTRCTFMHKTINACLSIRGVALLRIHIHHIMRSRRFSASICLYFAIVLL